MGAKPGFRLSRFFERDADSKTLHRGRLRLLALLLLFDAVLISATLLSFQKAELIEEETILLQTRQVYDIEVREQVITNTTMVTEVIPYGGTIPDGNER